MKKAYVTIMMAAVLSAAWVFTVSAGEWQSDERGYKYHNDSNSYARDQIMNIDGSNYGFDKDAYMISGWGQFDSKWYYFEPGSGAMVNGWKQLGEEWYYMDPASGVMQTAWTQLGNKLYYFHENGAMQKANTRFFVNGFGYETDESGAVKRNITEDKGDGRIFIYEGDGKMKYTNNTLKTGNMAGGTDVYTYLMEDSLNEQVKANTKQIINDEIEARKDELYEEYKERVIKESRSKTRAAKLTKWETKVSRELGELGESQEKIATYITSVKTGRYDRDDEWYEDYYYSDDYNED